MGNINAQDRADAIAWLRDNLAPGSEVSTIVTHVSASGMSRNIVALAVINGEIVNVSGWLIRAGIGTRPRGNGSGVTVGGAGMDMGFHLVYQLAHTIHGDGYSLRQRWSA